MAKGISTFYGQQYIEPEAPNLFLNSDMYRAQRGSALLVDNDYTLDRWVTRAVNQTIANSASVRVTQSTTLPIGVGVRNAALIEAFQPSTRLAFGQRIDQAELEPYRGKILKLSTYVRRAASLAGCRLQLAYSEGSGVNDYASAQISDMANIVYDDAFDSHSDTGFTRISADIIVTDTMVDNGFQCGIKVLQSGETSADITGNLMYVTGFMINRSDVLTPYKRFEKNQGLEDLALQRYYEKSYGMDVAPGTNTTRDMSHVTDELQTNKYRSFSIPFKVEKRIIPAPTVYDKLGNINKVSYVSGSSGTSWVFTDNGTPSSWSINDRTGKTSFAIRYGFGGTTGGIAIHWTADAEIR